MTYKQIRQALVDAGKRDVIIALEGHPRPLRRDVVIDDVWPAEFARRVSALLYGDSKDTDDWRVIAPLKVADVIGEEGHLHALVWAVATEIRAGQIAAANARMIAAGCLICPACGNDGADGDSSSPPFAYLETMDSSRPCGVKLRGRGSERTVAVSDVYQDDYEGARDERVCCQVCGWEFELPEGGSFEHGVSGGVIDVEVDGHEGPAKPARTKRASSKRGA